MAEMEEKKAGQTSRKRTERRRQARAGRGDQPQARPRRLGREEETLAADGSSRAAAGGGLAEGEEVTAARLLLALSLGLIAKGAPMAIHIESSAFSEGEKIPRQYTCDGKDISPPLSWSGVPEGAKSLALICDDPDASKTWVHWVIFNLPARTNGLPEAVPARERRSGRRHAGHQRFPEGRLRRALPSERDPPLHVQALRARHGGQALLGRDQGGPRARHEGARPGRGNADGQVLPRVSPTADSLPQARAGGRRLPALSAIGRVAGGSRRRTRRGVSAAKPTGPDLSPRSAIRGHVSSSWVWRRRPTGATAPGGSLRETSRAIFSFAPCMKRDSPISPSRAGRATG